MNQHSSRVAPDFEWNGFLNRNRQVLIDPREPKRSVETMGFSNQNHASTKAIIAGSLERKSKVLKKYEPGFYAVTPSKFLHEFKSNDNYAKDPVPENSLFLPDCVIGALDGSKFAVKGKDASKGSIGSKLAMSHEYQFQAHTPQDAQKWYDAIRAVAGQTSSEMPDSGSDIDSRNSSRVGTGLEGAGAGAGAAGVAGTHQTGAAPAQQQYAAAPGQTVPGQTMPHPSTTAGGVPGQTVPGQTIPGQTLPGQTLPGQTLPGQTGQTATGVPPISTQEGGLGAHSASGGHAPIGSAVSTSGEQAVPSPVQGAPQQRF